MKYDRYLPIGTVVLLKGATKKVMITGFCIKTVENSTIMYDYTGCMYPEGMLSSEQNCVFNHEQIDKIYYLGYINEEETKFKTQLKEILLNSNVNDF